MAQYMRLMLFLVFLVLLYTPSIQAAPIKSITTLANGIDIEHPFSESFKLNTDHKFHFHLFNSSSGLPILNNSDVSCVFHLYNQTGSHILKVNKVSSDDTYDWEQIVSGGNFSKVGNYAYVLQCNNSFYGGYLENDFYVTNEGMIRNVQQSIGSLSFLIIILSMVIIFGVLGMRLMNNEILWVLGVLCIFLSIVTLTYGIYLGIEYRITSDMNDGMSQILFSIYLTILTASGFMALVLLIKNWSKIFKELKKAVTQHDPDDDNYDGFINEFDKIK